MDSSNRTYAAVVKEGRPRRIQKPQTQDIYNYDYSGKAPYSMTQGAQPTTKTSKTTRAAPIKRKDTASSLKDVAAPPHTTTSGAQASPVKPPPKRPTIEGTRNVSTAM